MNVFDVLNYLNERGMPRTARQISTVFGVSNRLTRHTLKIMSDEKLLHKRFDQTVDANVYHAAVTFRYAGN